MKVLQLITLSLLSLLTFIISSTSAFSFRSAAEDFFHSVSSTFSDLLWTTKSPKRIINVADAPVTVPVAPVEVLEKMLLPPSFDARRHWPICAEVISHVSHQGSCGSCWAFITTDVAADRLCIASQGKRWFALNDQ